MEGSFSIDRSIGQKVCDARVVFGSAKEYKFHEAHESNRNGQKLLGKISPKAYLARKKRQPHEGLALELSKVILEAVANVEGDCVSANASSSI